MKGEYVGKGTIQFGQMLDGKFVATGLPQAVSQLRVGPPADVEWLPDETWDEGERPISLAKERATAFKCNGSIVTDGVSQVLIHPELLRYKRVTIHLGPGAFDIRDLQKLLDQFPADMVDIKGSGMDTVIVGGVQLGDGRIPDEVLKSIRKYGLAAQDAARQAFCQIGEACRLTVKEFAHLHRKELSEIVVTAPPKHKQPFWTRDWRKEGRR